VNGVYHLAMVAMTLPRRVLLAFALLSTACTSEADEAGSAETGETAAEACAPRPVYPETYSSCAGAATCGVSGYACASQSGLSAVYNPAYCASACQMDSQCPTIPECSAVSTCVSPNGGAGVCALECADGKQCPDGMMCLPDITDGVTFYYCF
jgi:hypothetical protein